MGSGNVCLGFQRQGGSIASVSSFYYPKLNHSKVILDWLLYIKNFILCSSCNLYTTSHEQDQDATKHMKQSTVTQNTPPLSGTAQGRLISYLSIPSIPPPPTQNWNCSWKTYGLWIWAYQEYPPPHPPTWNCSWKSLGLWIWAQPESPSPNKNWNFSWSIMWGELVCGNQSLYPPRIPSRLFSLVGSHYI